MKLLPLICLFFLSFTCVSQNTWTALENAPANTNNTRYDDVFFLNEQLGWIANGTAGNIFKTENGGISWTEQLNETDINADTYYRNIEFFDENIGIVTSLNRIYFRTEDGGNTWDPLSLPNAPDAVCGLSRVSNTTMYGCGAFFGPAFILKTTDAGLNWTYTDLTAFANALVEVLFVDEMIGYASGKSDTGGVVLKTTDGGLNWSEVYNSNIAGEYVWKLQFVEGDTDVIYGSIESVQDGKIIKSFDTGVTWEEKIAPIRAVQSIGFETQNRGWVGGHTGNLFETSDGGETWTELSVGINSNRIFFIGETAYCAAATILKLDEVLSVSETYLGTRKDLPLVIAPLPVKDKLNFKVTYFESDNAIIEVYDINGKLLKQLIRDANIAKGEKNYSFDFTYPTGTYFLSIQNNTGRQSMSFIKQ